MTVASGPLPNAGSSENVSSIHGSAIATTVAVEDAAKTETPTDTPRPELFQCHHTRGPAIRASVKPMATPVSVSRPTIRPIGTPSDKPRTTDGFGLRANRIRQVDDPRHEEGKYEVDPKNVLESSDEICGQQCSTQPEQEPGKPMPEATAHGLFTARSRSRGGP